MNLIVSTLEGRVGAGVAAFRSIKRTNSGQLTDIDSNTLPLFQQVTQSSSGACDRIDGRANTLGGVASPHLDRVTVMRSLETGDIDTFAGGIRSRNL